MSSYLDVVGAVLPKSWSQTKKNNLAEQIAQALADAGVPVEAACRTVAVEHALIPVETVEAYGLEIKLDATGSASEIHSRAGLVVVE